MLKIYDEYQKYGVKDYYKKYSKEYYNPHQDKIKNIYKKYLYNIVSRNDKIILFRLKPYKKTFLYYIIININKYVIERSF